MEIDAVAEIEDNDVVWGSRVRRSTEALLGVDLLSAWFGAELNMKTAVLWTDRVLPRHTECAGMRARATRKVVGLVI